MLSAYYTDKSKHSVNFLRFITKLITLQSTKL